MFQWRKEMDRLDIPAANVRRLHRSLSDIQVALPGLPAQQSTAYLCLFTAGDGFGLSVVFHLHFSRQLAFYLPDLGKIRKQDVGRILNEGIHFAESMGFILGDFDFHHLDLAERVNLWNSLPLKNGAAAGAKPAGTPPKEAAPSEEADGEEFEGAEELEEAVGLEEAEELDEAEELEEFDEGEEFDKDRMGGLEKDLGIRQEAVLRKRKPAPEEMEARRQTLLENLGRFLSSL